MKRHVFLSFLGIITLFSTQLFICMTYATTVAPEIVNLEPTIIMGVEKDIAKIKICKHGEIRSITLQQIRELSCLEDIDVESLDLEIIKPELEEMIAIEAEEFDPTLFRPHPVILKNITLFPQHPLAGPGHIPAYPITVTLEPTEQELDKEILSDVTTSSIPPILAPTTETICFQLQPGMKLLRLVVHMKNTNTIHVRYIRVLVRELPCCGLCELNQDRITLLEKGFKE